MHEKKLSFRKISDCLGISRETVSEYSKRSLAAGITWPIDEGITDEELEKLLFPAKPPSIANGSASIDWQLIQQEMKKKNATLQQVHQECLASTPTGVSYSHFCRGYRDYMSSLKVYMRFEHAYGECVFVDFCGSTVNFTDPTSGEVTKSQIFVGVLGGSSYIYAEAVLSQSTENWINAHIRMFKYFGGAPQMVIPDNLKAAVIKASNTIPWVNPSYEDMARHYSTVIFPARSRRPKDKAKAENGVQFVQRAILFPLRNKVFNSLAEVNNEIFMLLERLNSRPFKKIDGSRKSNFIAHEKPALNPLPHQDYVIREFRKSRVGMDYHIKIDEHLYSVPYQHAKKEVDVIITADMLEVVLGNKRIASHIRSYADGKSTNPIHMPANHRYIATWSKDDQLIWGEAVGPNTRGFMDRLLDESKSRMILCRQSDAMKKLLKIYGALSLENACAYALSHQIVDLRRLQTMLSNGVYSLGTNKPKGIEATFDHDNIRGPDYYH